jgi:hypothetical protein
MREKEKEEKNNGGENSHHSIKYLGVVGGRCRVG